MRKLFLTAIFSVIAMSFGYAQTDTSILPQNAQNFIEEHFGDATVKKVEKEDGWFSMDKSEMYEVHFTNGVKLDFNKAGEVTEIDSRENAKLPTKAIPSQVNDYVMKNYKGASVVSWEKDSDEQEVKLSNGTDLEFDKMGKFLKED